MSPGQLRALARAVVWRALSSMWWQMCVVPWGMHPGFLWEPPSAPSLFSVEDAAGGVAGVACAHPVDNSAPSGFTYADDSCLWCVIRRNIDVASAVVGACVLVVDVLLKRGMVDRGKSAALLEIRGALSRSAKRELFLGHCPCVSLPGTSCVVHLERSYVHLGSDVCVGGSMGPAVAARVRAHAQAMTPFRRCVCPRRAVSAKAKLTFVDSLATSRLCHSVGDWDKLSRGACRPRWSVATGVRCLCRTVALPRVAVPVLRCWQPVANLARPRVCRLPVCGSSALFSCTGLLPFSGCATSRSWPRLA